MCMLPFIAPKLVKSANKFPTAKTLIASPFLQKLPQWLAIFEMKPKLRRPFIRMSSHKARVGITFLICFLLSAAWKCNKKQWWRNEEDKSTVKIKWFKMNRKLWTRTWILATKNCIFLHLWIYSYFRVGDFGCFPFFLLWLSRFHNNTVGIVLFVNLKSEMHFHWLFALGGEGENYRFITIQTVPLSQLHL